MQYEATEEKKEHTWHKEAKVAVKDNKVNRNISKRNLLM